MLPESLADTLGDGLRMTRCFVQAARILAKRIRHITHPADSVEGSFCDFFCFAFQFLAGVLDADGYLPEGG